MSASGTSVTGKQDDARKSVKALKLEVGTSVEELVRMALTGA